MEGAWDPISKLRSYESERETFTMWIQWDAGTVCYCISPALANTADITSSGFLKSCQRFINEPVLLKGSVNTCWVDD